MSTREQNKGCVYLIPTLLAPNTHQDVLPSQVFSICNSLNYFLAENIRSARRFLSKLSLDTPISELNFEKMDKQTSPHRLRELIDPVVKGTNVGILSEAGCPAIADPGSSLVLMAHTMGIRVKPLVGPSSILLALMGSGLNGQSFAFHGYLPINKEDRRKRIRVLENNSIKYGQTQIFMETPYRNQHLFEDILRVCDPETNLSIAKNLTDSMEYLNTMPCRSWQKHKPDLHKFPTIFLLGQGILI